MVVLGKIGLLPRGVKLIDSTELITDRETRKFSS